MFIRFFYRSSIQIMDSFILTRVFVDLPYFFQCICCVSEEKCQQDCFLILIGADSVWETCSYQFVECSLIFINDNQNT